MKRILLIFSAIILTSISIKAQYGFGTNQPNPNAIVHVYSADSSKGFMIPIVKAGVIPATPALRGMIVYNASDSCIKMCTGSDWRCMVDDKVTISDDQNIDSVRLNGTNMTVYIEDGSSSTVDLQPIIDSALANETDNQTIDVITLSGTNLNLSLENDAEATKVLDLSPLIDSAYVIISDSLLNDNSFLSELKDSINTDDQTLTVGAGTALTSIIDIEGSSSDITLQEGSNIQLTELGNTITIAASGDGTGTDDQNLSVTAGSGTSSVIDIEGGNDVTINAGTGLSISETGTSITLNNTVTNTDDQNLTLGAGTATTSVLNMESGSDVTIQAGSNITLNESGSTLTIAAAGDGTGTDDQNLSVTAGSGTSSVIDIEGGNDVTINAGTGLSISETGTSITLNNTVTNTDNQNLTLGAGTATTSVLNMESGSDVTIQAGSNITLNESGSTLTIAASGDGTGTDDQNLSVTAGSGTSSVIDIEGGNDVTINAGTGLSISETGTSITLNNTVTNTDDQNLSVGAGTGATSIIQMENGNNVTLQEGSNIVLSESGSTITIAATLDGTGTDDQNLSVTAGSGTSSVIDIEGGNDVTINAGTGLSISETGTSITLNNTVTNTDDQNLTLGAGTATTSVLNMESGSDVTIQAGTNVTLSESGSTLTIAAAGDGTGTDDQNLTLGAGTATTSVLNMESGSDVTIQAGTNVTLSESGSTLTIAAAGDGTGTDDQNLSVGAGTGATSIIQMENGNNVTLQEGSNIVLSESGSTITIAATLDGTGTDDQNLSVTAGSGTSSVIDIEGGNDVTINAGTGLSISETGTSITLNNTVTNTDDQNLTLGAGTATTSVLNMESGSDVTIQAGTNVTLSESGSTLTIAAAGDGTGTDNQNLTLGAGTATTSVLNMESGSDVTIQAGTNVTLSESGSTLTIAAAGDGTGTDNQNLTLGAGTATTSVLNMESGSDVTIQAGTNVTLSESGSTLTIAAAGDGTGTDDQNLSVGAGTGATSIIQMENGNNVTLQEGSNIVLSESGSTITIAATLDGTGTDDQNLSVTAGSGTSSVIDIEGGNDVTINAGTGLSISETGTSITLNNTVTNTDNQNLTLGAGTASTSVLNMESGSDVTIQAGTNVTLSESGSTLTIAAAGDGTGTDDQNLSVGAGTGATSIIQMENGNNVTLEEGTGIILTESGSTITIAAANNGDITGVTAGAGLTGGGSSGTPTITAAANNGLNVDAGADRIQLGGALTEATTITQSTFGMTFNLNSTGDFHIQDNGGAAFTVLDNGDVGLGDATPSYQLDILEGSSGNVSDNAARIDFNGTAAAALTANRTHQGLYVDYDATNIVGGTASGTRHYGYGVRGDVTTNGTTRGYIYKGVYGLGTHSSSGDITTMQGVDGYAQTSNSAASSGDVTTLIGTGGTTVVNPNSTGLVSNAYSLYAYNLHNNANTLNNARGNYNYVRNNAAGRMNNAYGEYNLIENRATGTIGGAYGNYNYLNNTSTTANAITTAYGNYSRVRQGTAGGGIPTAYGSYVQVEEAAGTIGTSYLYYGVTTGTHGNEWGLYLTGETQNRVGGRLGVGANPAVGNMLDVNGKTQTTNFQMTNGATNNYVLRSDASGNGSWVNVNTLTNDTDDQNLSVGAGTGATSIIQMENGNNVTLEEGTGIILTESGSTITIAAANNGDITGVTAGAGLTGGGSSGTPTITAAANNGLNVDAGADRIQLGGALTEATTITTGANQMTFNLNSTGDFNVQDNGTTRFQVLDNGRIEMSGTTDASGTANSGVLEIANTLRLDGNEIITNTNTKLFIQNDNGGDLGVDGNTFNVDASTNRVGIGTAGPATTLHVVGNTRVSNLAGTGNRMVIADANGTLATQAIPSNGDITGVTAGDGLTGGGTSGTVTLNVVATNGLTDAANDVRLGGTLVQNTSIAQSTFNLDINLNSTGDFSIQDNGTDKFSVVDNGNSSFGSDVYWRDANSISGTELMSFIDDGNDGRLRINENGSTSVDLDANSGFIFNEQGLDRDFRVEGDNDQNAIRVEASSDEVGIGTGSPTSKLHVLKSNTGNGTYAAQLIDFNGSAVGALTANRTHRGLYIDYDASNIVGGSATGTRHSAFGLETNVNTGGTTRGYDYRGAYFLASHQSSGSLAALSGAVNYARSLNGSGGTLSNMYGSQNIAYLHATSGVTTNAYGTASSMTKTNANTTSWGRAFTGSVTNSGGGLLSNAAGAYNQVYNNGGNNSRITSAYGSYNIIQNNSTNSAISNAYGVYSHINQDDAGGSIPNSYAFYANQDRDNGTSTNAYLYYGAFNGTHSNKWGLYLTGDTRNRVGGRLGVGIDPAAGNQLQVAGKTHTTNFQMPTGAAVNRVLRSDAAGNASWVAASSLGNVDNLGNHTATTTLNMNSRPITNYTYLSATTANSYDKIRVWNSSLYTIGMRSAQTFGFLNDYAMTFTMSNTANRGFLWRDASDAASDGAMSLTTDGRLTVKSTVDLNSLAGSGTRMVVANAGGVLSTQAIPANGDITGVTAGTGLTGGGTTGTPTLNVIATNGLNHTANDVRLGGALIANTTITQGTRQMTFNLNSSGDFNVQDNGTTRFQVLDNGRIEMSGTTDASGAGNTGVLEIANALRFDANEIITNTNAELLINHDNNGDVRFDNTTLMVDASANSVGVGTTGPLRKLDVRGGLKLGREGIVGSYNSTQVQGIWSIGESYPINTGTNDFGTQYGMVYAHTNAGTVGAKKPIAGFGHQILFTTSGSRTAAISLTSGHGYFAGNMGIGTTGPSQKLHVVGNGRFTTLGGGGTRMVTTDNNGVLGATTLPTGDITGVTAGNGLTGGGTSGTPTITANVGGGLHITSDQIRLGGTLAANEVVTLATRSLDVNLSSSGDFAIQDAGVDKFFAQDNGNFGFGGDVVFRDVNAVSGTIIGQMLDENNDGRFILYENGGIAMDLRAANSYTFNENSADRNFRVESNGNQNMLFVDAGLNRVGIGTATLSQALTVNGRIKSNGINETSDKRYKKEIKDLAGSLDKVMKLRGVNYQWRKDEFPDMQFEDGTQLGVIAQEIETIFPEVVYTDDNGYKSVDYSHLVPVLIEAIKEQQKEIEELKQLNQKVNRLEQIVLDMTKNKK